MMLDLQNNRVLNKVKEPKRSNSTSVAGGGGGFHPCPKVFITSLSELDQQTDPEDNEQ